MDSGTLRIVVRADASEAIGAGHVMRCLSLAGALSGRARVQFAAYDLPAPLASRVEAADCDVLPLSAPADPAHDAADLRFVMTQHGRADCDCLIVDHYGLDAAWSAAMRGLARRIFVIDDTADRPLSCDIVLNHNSGAENLIGQYRELAPAGCRLLLGAKYALVAPAFAERRSAALARRNTVWPPRRVLISTGFSDLGGAALTAATALAGTEWDVRVAIGSAAASLPALEALATHAANVTILRDCTEMAEEMLRADIMIGAPGTTSWERATLAIPSLLVIAADNQRANAKLFAERGAGVVLGDAGALQERALLEAITELNRSRSAYTAMSAAAAELCDGQGAAHVAAALLEALAQ